MRTKTYIAGDWDNDRDIVYMGIGGRGGSYRDDRARKNQGANKNQ